MEIAYNAAQTEYDGKDEVKTGELHGLDQIGLTIG